MGGLIESQLKKDCICGASAIEDVGYILVEGRLYCPERAAYINPYLKPKKYFKKTKNNLTYCREETCVSPVRLHS